MVSSRKKVRIPRLLNTVTKPLFHLYFNSLYIDEAVGVTTIGTPSMRQHVFVFVTLWSLMICAESLETRYLGHRDSRVTRCVRGRVELKL